MRPTSTYRYSSWRISSWLISSSRMNSKVASVAANKTQSWRSLSMRITKPSKLFWINRMKMLQRKLKFQKRRQRLSLRKLKLMKSHKIKINCFKLSQRCHKTTLWETKLKVVSQSKSKMRTATCTLTKGGSWNGESRFYYLIWKCAFNIHMRKRWHSGIKWSTQTQVYQQRIKSWTSGKTSSPPTYRNSHWRVFYLRCLKSWWLLIRAINRLTRGW